MVEVPKLIQDLALILGVAGVVTILCKWIKQPVVLGYIIAGFLVGPHFKIFPTIQDTHNIHVWAEMGVIFLLFGLGLEFSFKKLVKTGPSASVIAIVEILFMLGLGWLCGRFLGWSEMDSLFLGGILSISSTTIIFRAIDELGLRSRRFVGLVFGVLIVEDLVAVLLMVLLSTIAVSQQFQGAELVFESAKLGFFLVLWFLTGIFLLPTLLQRSRRFLSDETLLVLSIGLCLIMVLLAHGAGFSPALGAFMMGSLLAETNRAEKIVHLTEPVRNLFAAIFFVSVGMLINPQTLIDQAWPVFIITLVTIFGKAFASVLGALLSGQTLRHSVQVGLSLAQIGEFSFIIASLGLSLKVTGDFLYPIAVAVSALTTLSTPYLIKASDSVAQSLEQRLPASWISAIRHYNMQMHGTSQSESWRKVLRSRLAQVLANSIIVIAVFWLCERGFEHWVQKQGEVSNGVSILFVLISLALAAPFLWAVAFGGIKANSMREAWREARTLGPLFVVEIFRIALSLVLVLGFLSRVHVLNLNMGLVAMGGLVVLFFFWLRLRVIYHWFEARFLSNFNEREKETPPAPLLAPWDAHLVNFQIPAEASFAGQTLVELGIREKFGISIALIQRGQKRIAAPGRDERLFPNDEIGVIGNDEQLLRFRNFLREHSEQNGDGDIKDYILRSFLIGPDSPFKGQMIRYSGIRERFRGLVVGLERRGERILNPDSTVAFEEGDLVWIVGDESRFRR